MSTPFPDSFPNVQNVPHVNPRRLSRGTAGFSAFGELSPDAEEFADVLTRIEKTWVKIHL